MSIDFNTKSKIYENETIGEYIRCIDGELAIDAVGLWQIIPYSCKGKVKFSTEVTKIADNLYKVDYVN
jgi:hypothetical protein